MCIRDRYKGTTELATATSNELLTTYPTAAILSAPFDVFGSFNYVTDKSWTYSGWNAANSVIPTKAVITVTFKNGVVKTVTKNNALTGDTTIFTKVMTKAATDVTLTNATLKATNGNSAA